MQFEKSIAFIAMFALAGVLITAFVLDSGEFADEQADSTIEDSDTTTQRIGTDLFVTYGFSFVAVGILLGASLAGGIYLARTDDVDEDEIGEILEEAR